MHNPVSRTGRTLTLAVMAALALISFNAHAEEPSADFRWYGDDLTVHFQDLSTGEVNSWLWEFGNGDIATKSDPIYTYPEIGTFYVTLTVGNQFGESHRTYPITVSQGSGNAPNADFTWASEQLSTVFVDLSVGQIDEWLWTFGDGNTSTEQNPTYHFAASGTFAVKLRATNEWGYSERTRDVTVTNEPGAAPEARFRWGAVGTTVFFEDRSYGTITERAWNFGDGNGSDATDPVYTYTGPGTYDVTLTVSNEFGDSSEIIAVQVDEVNGETPTADFRYVADGLKVYFDNLSQGQVDSQAWAFGDGTFSTRSNPVKTYDEAGEYDVELTVSNRFGSSSRIMTIEVGIEDGDPPFANYQWSANGLEATFEDRSIGEVESWSWSFGDGTVSDEQNPTHTFPLDGEYPVTLVVTNQYGNSSRTTNIVVGEIEEVTGYLRFVAGTGFAVGAENTFWRTALDINNRGTETLTYELWWLPRGLNNQNPLKTERFTLAPGTSRLFPNLLQEAFDLNPADHPFGSVAIASDSNDYVTMSRTFNGGADSSTGTVGQAMPDVYLGDMVVRGDKQRLVLMSENEAYRANVGCQSGIDKPIVIFFELFDQNGAKLGERSINLPPLSNEQINRIFAPFAPVNGYVDIWSDTQDSRFFCYGSVLDNVTSDPTTILTK